MLPIRGNRPNREYLPSVNGNTGAVPATRQGPPGQAPNGIPPTIGVNTIIRPEPAPMPEPLPEPAPAPAAAVVNGVNGENIGAPAAAAGVNMGAPRRSFEYSPEMEEYYNQLPPNVREQQKRLREQMYSGWAPSVWDASVRGFSRLPPGFRRPGNTRTTNRTARATRANNAPVLATRARAPPPMPGPRVRPPAPPRGRAPPPAPPGRRQVVPPPAPPRRVANTRVSKTRRNRRN